MRHLTFFISFCLLLWLAASSPINLKRRLINRPTKEEIFGLRSRRYANDYELKGRFRSATKARPQPLEHNIRKGEYMCGNRVCKLRPGEMPKGCNGMCQYHLPL